NLKFLSRKPSVRTAKRQVNVIVYPPRKGLKASAIECVSVTASGPHRPPQPPGRPYARRHGRHTRCGGQSDARGSAAIRQVVCASVLLSAGVSPRPVLLSC